MARKLRDTNAETKFNYDYLSGNIMLLIWNAYTELGNIMQLSVTSAPIHSDKSACSYPGWSSIFEQGVGHYVRPRRRPSGDDGYIKDGAHTDAFAALATAAVGEYFKRQRFLRLGQARVFVFRITITDPVKRVMIQAHAGYFGWYVTDGRRKSSAGVLPNIAAVGEIAGGHLDQRTKRRLCQACSF